MFFCTFDTDLYAQSALSNKISASGVSRKFIKSALLVGLSLSCSAVQVWNDGFEANWRGGRRVRPTPIGSHAAATEAAAAAAAAASAAAAAIDSSFLFCVCDSPPPPPPPRSHD